MIRADLHLHTLYSDGAYPPEELARRVKEAGVSLFSVTDHDSMEGAERARMAAAKEGLLFVQGWEVSSYEENGKVHMLGYRCKRSGRYFSFLQERKEGAYLRADDVRRKANAFLGLNVTMEEVEAFHSEKSAPLHTMHVVDAFCKALQADRLELYRACFAYGKPAYSDLFRPTPKEAVRIIHETGGIAVLAHPGQIFLDPIRKRALMEELIGEGLDGIECYHSTHTERESAEYAAFAGERALLVTGGSDFHAEGKERTVGLPVFYPSEALLEAFSL